MRGTSRIRNALARLSGLWQRVRGLPGVTASGTGDVGTRQGAAMVVATRLPFSPARALRRKVAFLRRAFEAFGRSRRHREVAARIAAARAPVPGSGVHVTHRLHRCPWCGVQMAYLFSCEVAYPDGATLSEKWRCGHCGGDHTRKV